jgi:molybdate transport system ATP-binding protein
MLKVNIQLRRDRFALDVALEQSSRITGVFGPSGSGKSTLLHAIAGLITPDSGQIELNGQTLFDSANGVNVPAHRRRIGLMFQDDRLFPHMNVRANLLYGWKPPASGRAPPRPAPLEEWEFVRLLELSELLSRPVTTLSGGERQRVALGRALLSNPRLLLLDEPLSSLDAALKRQIIPYLRRIRDAAGIPMLYVSHDLTEMLAMTNQLLLMEGGRSIAHGSYGALAHDHAALDALHDTGLVNVMRLTVVGRDESGGVVELAPAASDASAWLLRAAVRPRAAVGETVDVVIRAADVALAVARVQGVSIQNQVRGTVTRLTQHAGSAIVQVELPGGQALLAELTLRAVQSLGIECGQPMWCLVKSNAIRLAEV